MRGSTDSMDLDLLRHLTSLPALSGFEKPVADFICGRLAELGLETRVDTIGNVTAHIPGSGPRLMLIAHMDEVGFMVRKVYQNGFLAVQRVGGASQHALPGQLLHVWTDEGPLPGVVGVLPQHLARDVLPPPLDKVYIDVGASSREDAFALGIRPGTVITHAPTFELLNKKLICAKALDDRIGCYLLLRLAERWHNRRPECELWLAFVVQEESHLGRATLPVARAVKPQLAIGVDVTLAFDTPDLTDGQTDVALGEGPAIKVMDHLPGTLWGFLGHEGLRSHVENIAEKRGLPLQREIVVGLSTAVAPLPFAEEGIATAALSLPLRYSHSPVEVLHMDDVVAADNLLEALAGSTWPLDRILRSSPRGRRER